MMHDFDRILDRVNSDSIKWGRYKGRDILPMWVADMDFAVAPAIQSAIEERARHGIFGYAAIPPSLLEAACHWLAHRWGWEVDAKWLVAIPAVVPGLNLTARTLGTRLTWPSPVYGPIAQVAKQHNLPGAAFSVDSLGRWDLQQLEAQLCAGADTVLISHPHNPIGHVFAPDELKAFAKLVKRHKALVISDDIHGDLLLEPGARHCPLAKACPDIAGQIVTLISPGKTFNLAGLPFALAVVSDDDLRSRLKKGLAGVMPAGNVLSYAAAEAAYRHGEPWLEDLLEYLRGNRALIEQAVAGMEGVEWIKPEATYLAWLDFREKGWESPARKLELFGLGLSDGTEFGTWGYARLNFACPRATLEQGLERLGNALASKA